MSIVKPLTDFPALEIRGKFSRAGGLGLNQLGKSMLGFFQKNAGIYQKRPRKHGQIFVKSRFYVPTNPRTAPQQAWRNTFKSAMSAWAALDEPTRQKYTVKGYSSNLDARSAFLREYLRAAR